MTSHDAAGGAPSSPPAVVCRATFRGKRCGLALRPMRLNPMYYMHIVAPTFRHTPLPYRVPR